MLVNSGGSVSTTVTFTNLDNGARGIGKFSLFYLSFINSAFFFAEQVILCFSCICGWGHPDLEVKFRYFSVIFSYFSVLGLILTKTVVCVCSYQLLICLHHK